MQLKIKGLFLTALLVSIMWGATAQNNRKMATQQQASVGKETGSKAVVVAYIEILPAFEKEVKEAMVVMAAASNREAGCEQFVANTRNDSPLSLVIYEEYKNDKAFEVHKASAHAKYFFEFVKGKIVNDKIEIVLLTALKSTK